MRQQINRSGHENQPQEKQSALFAFLAVNVSRSVYTDTTKVTTFYVISFPDS